MPFGEKGANLHRLLRRIIVAGLHHYHLKLPSVQLGGNKAEHSDVLVMHSGTNIGDSFLDPENELLPVSRTGQQGGPVNSYS